MNECLSSVARKSVFVCVCVRACVRVGNTDYQTLHEKELKLVEEETQRRIKCLLEGTCPSTSGRSCIYL